MLKKKTKAFIGLIITEFCASVVTISALYPDVPAFEYRKLLQLLVDGIATRYGLDGPGIESRWRLTLGITQPPVQRVPGLLPGGKVVVWR
jgi:hypothetical protein